jgi:hypothetical protein
MPNTTTNSESRNRSCGRVSNYAASADNLNGRGVDPVETPFVPYFFPDDSDGPRQEGRKAVQAFLGEVVTPEEAAPALDAKDLEECHEKLLGAISGPQATENSFNAALFGAMAECVRRFAESSAFSVRRKKPTPWGSVTVTETAILLVRKDNKAVGGYEYATGLAREVKLPPGSGCILRGDARPDHAWVIYRRAVAAGNTMWVVWRALAVVDFKFGNGDCQLAKTMGGNVDRKSLILSESVNGPLAQVIMYTFAHAVPGRAALGELPPSVPFAVVACRTDASQRIEIGWVHGNLVTPAACGERFAFNVDAYGPVGPQGALNDRCLAAYLNVMTNGLEAAVRWLKRLALEAPEQLPPPHPMSGRELRFGAAAEAAGGDEDVTTIVPDARLVATPALDGIEPHFRITQGELFLASVNLSELRASLSTTPHRVFWCLDAVPADPPTWVLIKVTSKTCFNLLIPSHSAFLYSVRKSAIRRFWGDAHEVRRALSQSLLGVYVTPDESGLVQLLPALHLLGYESIPHGKVLHGAGWAHLWRAFAGLVDEVLIPLARAGLVHADVRPGYDSTSNLLYHPAKASMKLIDLDSLCDIADLKDLSTLPDGNIISVTRPPAMLKTAMGFVLGQVVCAAEVWLNATPHSEVQGNAAIQGGLRSVESRPDPGVFDPDAFDAGGVFHATVDEDLIRTVLDRYREKFEQRAGLRRSRRRCCSLAGGR